MKTLLIAIGKTDNRYLTQAVDDYLARANHYAPIELKIIPDIRDVKNLSQEQQKEREGQQIVKLIQPGDYVILLDEGGKEFTSVGFSQWLQQRMNTVSRRLVFVIGGPYGFSPEVYALAQGKISLSQMTFSHQMVRVIFAEQFYRALSILNNLPYHHQWVWLKERYLILSLIMPKAIVVSKCWGESLSFVKCE